MEIIRDHEASPTDMLYEASMRGCVATLKNLIQIDPLILHKVSLSSFSETPLHISALLGHVEFTKALLSQKPDLVTELDSSKRSPLHLASAEGHQEIVKELLLANKDVCLFADKESRIPLHLAAIRGRIEVIKELISAKPESVRVSLHGDTVLHLCVIYNHLDALKLLLASVSSDVEFLNSKDHLGNTILLASAKLNQLEITRYLLSVPQIRVDLNSLIENGFPGFDANTNGSIQNNMQKSVIGTTISNTQSNRSAKKSKSTLRGEAQLAAESSFNWKKFVKSQNDWYQKTRGNLMIVATLIATMSFQVATTAPGGYWQLDTTNKQNDTSCPEGKVCRAGTSIHAYTHEYEYHVYIIFSTLSFSASLSIILLLISGVPLRNKISIGILVIGMWTAILFLATAYYFSISLVQVPGDGTFKSISHYYPRIWVVLLFAICLIHVIRFCWWLLKKLFIGLIYLVKCCLCLPVKKKRQPDQHAVIV